ncbi:MAG: DUF4328 domain-containing protein [Mycobacteriaceae bacterium]
MIQVCARCATRWSVGERIEQWCPRCQGVLLQPEESEIRGKVGVAYGTGSDEQLVVPKTQGQSLYPPRRAFHWVAKSAYSIPKNHVAQTRSKLASDTPHYSSIPRWGLKDRLDTAALTRKKPFTLWLASQTDRIVKVTMISLGAAILSQLWRYWLLWWNQTHLLSTWSVHLSDFFVAVTGAVALLTGALSAVCLSCWLIDFRKHHYARSGERDPRSGLVLTVGCLFPILNIVMPGVFINEIALAAKDFDNKRLLQVVRIWWLSWVFSWLAFIGFQLWRFLDSLAAVANSALLAAFVNVIALGCLFMTTQLVQELRCHENSKVPRRWTVSGHADLAERIVDRVT